MSPVNVSPETVPEDTSEPVHDIPSKVIAIGVDSVSVNELPLKGRDIGAASPSSDMLVNVLSWITKLIGAVIVMLSMPGELAVKSTVPLKVPSALSTVSEPPPLDDPPPPHAARDRIKKI